MLVWKKAFVEWIKHGVFQKEKLSCIYGKSSTKFPWNIHSYSLTSFPFATHVRCVCMRVGWKTFVLFYAGATIIHSKKKARVLHAAYKWTSFTTIDIYNYLTSQSTLFCVSTYLRKLVVSQCVSQHQPQVLTTLSPNDVEKLAVVLFF